MNVLHVIPSVSPVRGGPSQAILELAAAARRIGQKFDIVTTNDDGPGMLDIPVGESVEFNGVPVRFFPKWPAALRPLREFSYSGELGEWLSRSVFKYDLIHVHALFSYASTVAMRTARNAGIPYIVRPSGLLCRWSLEQSRLRKSLYLRLIERKNLNSSSAIEYTSEQEQEEASDLNLSSSSFVMPYGVNIPSPIPDARKRLRAEFELLPDEPIVLFLSRLHPKKGIHHLISAAGNLLDKRFSLLIAGTGDKSYEREIIAHASGIMPKTRFRFVGFASGEKKDLFLQGSDVFVLPSFSESFAIAVMEAMAVGLPVVTTPGVPLSLLVEKYGLGAICQPEVTSLTRQLEIVLEKIVSTGWCAERRTLSRSLILQNFTWPVIAKRMDGVYKAILKRDIVPSYILGDMAVEGTM